MEQAKQAGFRTVLLYIGLETPELSAERVAARVDKGGHPIPLKDIVRRHPKSLANASVHIKAFDVAHVYDNSDRRIWVAGFRNGLLTKKAAMIPKWIAQSLNINID